MNELTDIANVLTNDNLSLSSGLFKLKLIAGRLQNTELENWLKPELTGYKKDDTVPPYRKTVGFLKVIHSDNNLIYIKDASSIIKDEECLSYINNIAIFDDIARVEYYIKANLQQPVQVRTSENFIQKVSGILKNNPVYSRMNIYDIQIVINTPFYTTVISNVRYYALGIINILENTLGYGVDMKELLKQKNESNEAVNKFFTINNILCIGNNNTTNTGNNNEINK